MKYSNPWSNVDPDEDYGISSSDDGLLDGNPGWSSNGRPD